MRRIHLPVARLAKLLPTIFGFSHLPCDAFGHQTLCCRLEAGTSQPGERAAPGVESRVHEAGFEPGADLLSTYSLLCRPVMRNLEFFRAGMRSRYNHVFLSERWRSGAARIMWGIDQVGGVIGGQAGHDTGRHVQLTLVGEERRCEQGQYPFGQQGDIVLQGDIVPKESELVAAEACHPCAFILEGICAGI